MSKNVVTDAVNQFNKTINDLNIDLRNDNAWPVISDELLKDKEEQFQLLFWQELLIQFELKEQSLGHCHKGQIYWKLSLLFLQQGNLTKSIDNLTLSTKEDSIRTPNQFTAAIGLLSLIKPLVFRYRDGKEWTFNQEINDFYESLNDTDKRNFANDLFNAHNLSSLSQIRIIKGDFFGFIIDKRTKQIVFDTYSEVRDAIFTSQQKTYYSCIFAMGSILEAMLDDFLQRDSQRVWKLFHDNNEILTELKGDTKLKSTDYDSGMTLGQKIRVVLMLAKHNKLPMKKHAVLHMLIIGEYRDLIHPRRRLEFEYKLNKYVAASLFTIISLFAGEWWPTNIEEAISKK